MRLFCAWLALLCVLCGRGAFGQESADLARKLEGIRLGVAGHEKEIARMRAEFSVLLKQRKDLESTVKKLKQEEQGLLTKLDQLSQERDLLMHKVQASEEAVAEVQAKITRRLRALYMGSSRHISGAYLWRAEGSNMERVAVYVRAVREFDDARFQAVRKVVSELDERRAALDRSYTERKSVQDTATAKRIEAETQASKLKALSDQLNQKKRSAEASLAKLHKEAERLEILMAALMSRDTSGEGVPQDGLAGTPTVATPESRLDTEQVQPGGAAIPTDIPAPQKIELIPGGLFSKAVRIAAPVKGKVVQRFGKVKVTDFADMIFSKGLEFATAAGAEVCAVLAGKVAYVGALPGYETVVVVDHGSRSYSLYGRLGQSMVKAGQLISRDQTLGVTGEPDAKGRNFYFEVRKNGTPVDPTRVLSSLSR